MIYSDYIKNKVEKYSAFFEDKSPGQIIVLICPYTFELDYSQWGLPERTLDSWNFDSGVEDYVDYEVKKLRCFLEYTKDLDNDFIPALKPNLGVGVHSAYFSGSDVIFGKETSWAHPVIKQWEDIEKLKINTENKWFQLIMKITERFAQRCEGDYVTSSFCHFSPTDMANALRGNELFYDFHDDPEKVHELLNISTDAIIWLENQLKKYVTPVYGGSVTSNIWFPGNAPFFSEDVSDLCSPDIYREFGFKYTQRAIDTLGGAYIHHHAKGFHVHKDIAALNGLKVLEISLDPNCPSPIDHLEELYEKTNGIPLMTRCSAADVYEKIDQLKKGRTILMLNIDNLDEGREVMKFIRKNSKI